VITCSIVLYNNDPHLLERAVVSALMTEFIARVAIVDNSPSDRLRECLPQDRRVTYIHKPENLGFGKAHNLAFNVCGTQSDYHLVLNPDVYFGADVVPALKTYMDERPDVGVVMPKVLFPDGSTQHLCKLLPTPFDLLMRRFLPASVLSRFFEARMDQYEMRQTGYDREMRVPCLSGCFMFVRSSVYRQVEGFDERYFLYMEDVDLSRRIGALYRTMYFPGVHVFHAYGKGSYGNSWMRNLHIRSAIVYFSKWGWFRDEGRDRLNEACESVPIQRPIAMNSESSRSSSQ